MQKQGRKKIWIIVVIIILIIFSGEYADMARQTGIKEALFGFVLMTVLVLGIVYWIRWSRRKR